MRRCYVEQLDIYRIIRDYYSDDKTFNGGETTTRMLFLGQAKNDLRCVRFRHCWDHTPDYAQIDLSKYDGITQETEYYDVITFSEKEIERALMESTETEYYVKCGHPTAVELVGKAETKVNAWLYFPTEEGKDFSALRPLIEEAYGIHFPRSLVDWYNEGVPFSLEKEWLFPDWLDLTDANVASIKQRIANPKEWIVNDVRKGLWRTAWGEQPSSTDEALEKVQKLLEDTPPLIPICSHRYMLCFEGNEDPPVISSVGYDTVLYGINLRSYLKIEFEGELFPDEASVPEDAFWC